MNIKTDVALAPHTTFKIGGPAGHFVVVQSIKELTSVLQYAHTRKLPVLILGGGSNMLVSDDGFDGLVIKNAITGTQVVEQENTVTVTVGAGEIFDDVVANSVSQGWWGLENLSHIPGSVGATPIQNVGAYGVEVSDYIQSVHTVHAHTMTERVFSNTECQFGYRDSFFKTETGKDYIVTGVTFLLSRVPQPNCSYKELTLRFPDPQIVSVEKIREAVIDIRSQKFPDWHRIGTAGSFFKNPIISAAHYTELCKAHSDLPGFAVTGGSVKVSLGYVLDKVCGLKGSRVGPVGCYENQALVVVNYADATAAEVRAFARDIAQNVFEKTNITIEWEVTNV